MSVGMPTVAAASPGFRTTPLALMVPVPVFTTWTAKVTVTLPPMAGLTVTGAAGVEKDTARGEAAAATVMERVAGVDERPAAFLATTLNV